MLPIVAKDVEVLALVGLLGGVALLLLALVAPSVDPIPLKYAVITGFFIVSFPGIFLIQRRLRDYPQGQHGKLMYAGCPVWLRRATYVVTLGGVAIFFLSMLALPGPYDELEGRTTSVMLGGFSLALFAGVFSQLYSAEHLHEVAALRRCPAGHPVSFVARFCEQCGLPVRE